MVYEFGKDSIHFNNGDSGFPSKAVDVDDILDYLEDVIDSIDDDLKVIALQRARGASASADMRGKWDFKRLSRIKEDATELGNVLYNLDEDVVEVYVSSDFAKEIYASTVSYDCLRYGTSSVFQCIGEHEITFCVVVIDKKTVDYVIEKQTTTAKCYKNIVRGSGILVDAVMPVGIVASESANTMLMAKRALYKPCVCKDCGAVFELTRSEIAFFNDKGMDLPKRCDACRAKRRQSYDLRLMLLSKMGIILSDEDYDHLDMELRKRNYKIIDETARKHLGDAFVDAAFRSYGV